MGLLVLSVLGFRFVPQLYFPDSSRLQVMIDYWAPEGTRIQQTSADLQKIEKYLQEHPAVASVSAFIGKGPPRFYLPVSAEDPYTSYAQTDRQYENARRERPRAAAAGSPRVHRERSASSFPGRRERPSR